MNLKPLQCRRSNLNCAALRRLNGICRYFTSISSRISVTTERFCNFLAPPHSPGSKDSASVSLHFPFWPAHSIEEHFDSRTTLCYHFLSLIELIKPPLKQKMRRRAWLWIYLVYCWFVSTRGQSCGLDSQMSALEKKKGHESFFKTKVWTWLTTAGFRLSVGGRS